MEFWISNKKFFSKIAAKKKQFEKIFGISSIAGIFSCFVAALVLEELFFGFIIGLACFAIALAIQFAIPIMRERKRIALIERDLPFVLMSISIDLGLNINFEKCLLNASKSNLLIGAELKRIFFEIKEKGSSVQESLLSFSQRTKSPSVKRAVLQLASVYEHGNSKHGNGRNNDFSSSAETVRRLALELLSKQRIESKAFSGKLVVFSLLFIAVSAIVPALFQSFVIVGSMILKIEFTAMQIFSIITIGFPLLDLAVLFYIRAKTPVFLRG